MIPRTDATLSGKKVLRRHLLPEAGGFLLPAYPGVAIRVSAVWLGFRASLCSFSTPLLSTYEVVVMSRGEWQVWQGISCTSPKGPMLRQCSVESCSSRSVDLLFLLSSPWLLCSPPFLLSPCLFKWMHLALWRQRKREKNVRSSNRWVLLCWWMVSLPPYCSLSCKYQQPFLPEEEQNNPPDLLRNELRNSWASVTC